MSTSKPLTRRSTFNTSDNNLSDASSDVSETKNVRIPGIVECFLSDSIVLLRSDGLDDVNRIRRLFDCQNGRIISLPTGSGNEDCLRRFHCKIDQNRFALVDVVQKDDLSMSTAISVCSLNPSRVSHFFRVPNVQAFSVSAVSIPASSSLVSEEHLAIVEAITTSNNHSISTSPNKASTFPVSPIINVDDVNTASASSALSIAFRTHFFTLKGTRTHSTSLIRAVFARAPDLYHTFVLSDPSGSSSDVWVCLLCLFSDCVTPYRDHEGTPITAPDVRLILFRMSTDEVSAFIVRHPSLLSLNCVENPLDPACFAGYQHKSQLILRLEDLVFSCSCDHGSFTPLDLAWLVHDQRDEQEGGDEDNDDESGNDNNHDLSLRRVEISECQMCVDAASSLAVLLIHSPSHGLLAVDPQGHKVTVLHPRPLDGFCSTIGASAVVVNPVVSTKPSASRKLSRVGKDSPHPPHQLFATSFSVFGLPFEPPRSVSTPSLGAKKVEIDAPSKQP